jgi:hypothetical protein
VKVQRPSPVSTEATDVRCGARTPQKHEDGSKSHCHNGVAGPPSKSGFQLLFTITEPAWPGSARRAAGFLAESPTRAGAGTGEETAA